MASSWDRLESMSRSVELTGGLEAWIADPYWLLARQWQVGEFRGDDAAQPAAISVRGRTLPVTTFRPGGAGAESVPFPGARPLEEVAESTAEGGFGNARLHASARAGRRLSRMLREGGAGSLVPALRARFPLAEPETGVDVGEAGRAAVTLLARRGIDAAAVAAAGPGSVPELARAAVPPVDPALARRILTEWVAWYRRRGGFEREDTWDRERLEYAFSVGVRSPAGEIVLGAPEHTGGEVDWFSFDVAADPPADGSQGLGPARSIAAVPTPVRYTGMPASRWWEFEDAAVNFGAVDAGPADLARLLVAEFATSYGRDWFVVPITVPVGSLTELREAEVVDTMGGRTPVPSTAAADRDRTGASERAWRLFELTGDDLRDDHPAPWLFVPPTLGGSTEGPVLERVTLARDESANLVWGIEGLVEGPLGRAVDRSEAWYAAAPAAAVDGEPGQGPDDWWRYRLEAPAPPWWIPFVAERIAPDVSAQVRLRRARVELWALLGPHRQLGPQSVLLDPRAPCRLFEEEVPSSGVRLERSWQAARWHDGSLHVWLRRRKRPGRGEASSGVRWDLMTPPAD